MLTRRPAEPGGLLPTAAQNSPKERRALKTLANARADSNRWFYTTLASMMMTCVIGLGWYKAEQRYAENVRVAWVKLSPNGTANVEYNDDEKPIDYFTTTVESKLTEYAEKRFSKRKETISTDYGFAAVMQEPELKTHFMENEKAATVAAAMVECTTCDSEHNKIRTIQSIDKDVAPGTLKRQQYTTLVFSTLQKRDKTGKITMCENKIITLLWTFRPRAQIVERRDELRWNPLGMGIIREDIRADPTPMSEQECKKL